jgi:sugar lactone lactonase YvrE
MNSIAFKQTSRLVVMAIASMAPLCLTPIPATAADVLYGGLGGHNNGDSTNDGALVTVNQTNGAVTIVGHPPGVIRISGLAFDSAGDLYATTLIPPGGFPPPQPGTRSSNLITLNPNNGDLLTSLAITDGTHLLSIADLAIQPSTNTLFGITNPDGAGVGPGNLYTINPGTGLATLIGNTGLFFDSIAFAPNGTLYLAAANLDFATGMQIDKALDTIDPSNAVVLTSVPTIDFFGALGIRSDGTIFGGTGDQAGLFTINPTTGAETPIGNTGTTFIGDLAFLTPETGTTLNLMAIGLAGLVGCAHRLRRSARS